MTEPQSRADAIAWARAAYADRDAIYLDTETTGLKADAEIVSVAILDWRGRVLMDRLIRPERPIPPDATAVHGIGDADVEDAEPFECAAEAIVALLRDATRVIAFNAPFDEGIVRSNLAKVGRAKDVAADPWQCAMRAFVAYQRDRSATSQRGAWMKLAKAAEHFGYDLNAHRAVDDALAAYLIVEGMTVEQ